MSQKWHVHFSSLKNKHLALDAIPWTVANQAPPSRGFSGQEYWSGLPFPSPEDLPNSGIKPGSPAFQVDAVNSEPPGKPIRLLRTWVILGLVLLFLEGWGSHPLELSWQRHYRLFPSCRTIVLAEHEKLRILALSEKHTGHSQLDLSAGCPFLTDASFYRLHLSLVPLASLTIWFCPPAWVLEASQLMSWWNRHWAELLDGW